MTGHVRIVTGEGIARITIDNPPLNLLSAPVRRGLAAALDAAGRDPAVKVIVLAAAGRTWSAGADIREFRKADDAPAPGDICATIAQGRKPVIAALHGTVLGGGLELALAAALRLAAPGTELGLPEVALGLLPGAGGTQRLPRLVGAKAALGLLLSGLPVAAVRAAEIGLVDAVTEGGAEAAAEAIARSCIAGETDLPTTAERAGGRLVDPDGWLAAVAAARAGLGPARLPAPGRIIDCVEAALLLPEDEGFAFERTAFADLSETPEAAALSHVFLAERRAARQPDLGTATARQIFRAGILGGGETAAELAVALMALGIDVTMACFSTSLLQTVSAVSDTSAVDLMKEYQNPIWTAFEAIRTGIGSAGFLVPIVGAAVLALCILGAVSLNRDAPFFAPSVALHILLTTALLMAVGMRIWPRFYFVDIGLLMILIVAGVRLSCALTGHFFGGARVTRVLWVTGVVLMVLISAALAKRNYAFPKQDLAGAFVLVESELKPGDRVIALGYAGQNFAHYGADWPVIYNDAEYRAAMQAPGTVFVVTGFPERVFRDVPQFAADIGLGDGSDICEPGRPNPTVLKVVRCFGGTLGDGNVLVFRRD